MKVLDGSKGRADGELQTIEVQVRPHVRREQELSVSLTERHWTELCEALKSIFEASGPAPELRWVLSQDVTVYWKSGGTETRLMIARPDPSSWVATIVVATTQTQRVIGFIETLPARGKISFSELEAVWKLSNLELSLSWLPSGA